MRQCTSLLPNDQKKEVATQALEQAEQASRIAEAQIAKALGYELCKCQFPPTPMLTIGYTFKGRENVYRCPVCNRDSARGLIIKQKVS